MVKRSIIEINEEKCDGCGLCIPNCPEGALQIIDGKARLISDLFCDGLGACIGHCPKNAIKVIEREAEPYNELKVMANIVKHGENTIKAHLEHLAEHGETEFLNQAVEYLKSNNMAVPNYKKACDDLACGCPGSMVQTIQKKDSDKKETSSSVQSSTLSQWPIQLSLLPPQAPFFNNSNLVIMADCVGFANPNLHNELLKDNSIAIGCPKLDDITEYQEKIKSIIELNDLKSISVAIMQVPCCSGLYTIVEQALNDSGKKIPLKRIVIGIDGTTLE
ncbi:4Fe-4S binding protein [Candidatus Woesearchaeota archaeon]|nr:4Fe-4S binding protein [Candidatus Woesearchaeota archaeon]